MHFSSKYKRVKLISENKFYIHPQQIPIGFRWEMRCDQKTGTYKKMLIKIFFQFIPCTGTIEKVFENDYFREIFENFNSSHSCQPGIFKNTCCGNRFRSTESVI